MDTQPNQDNAKRQRDALYNELLECDIHELIPNIDWFQKDNGDWGERGNKSLNYHRFPDMSWQFCDFGEKRENNPIEFTTLSRYVNNFTILKQLGYNSITAMANALGIKYDSSLDAYVTSFDNTYKKDKSCDESYLIGLAKSNQRKGIPDNIPAKKSDEEIKRAILAKETSKNWVYTDESKQVGNYEVTLKTRRFRTEKGKPTEFIATRIDTDGNELNFGKPKSSKLIDVAPEFTTSDIKPFRYKELRNEKNVYIGEGETDANMLIALGINATCFYLKTQKAIEIHLKELKKTHDKMEEITYFADNDAPGIGYAKDMAKAADKVGLACVCINLFTKKVITKFDKKTDIPNFINDGADGINDGKGYDVFDFIKENQSEPVKALFDLISELIKEYKLESFETKQIDKKDKNKKNFESWMKRHGLTPTKSINQKYFDTDEFKTSELIANCTQKCTGLKGVQGTGKSISVVKGLADIAINNSANPPIILDITHLNSLSHNNSLVFRQVSGLNVAHWSKCEGVINTDGITGCIDSLIQKKGMDIDEIRHEVCVNGRELILNIDEVEQFIKHTMFSTTDISKHRAESVQILGELCRLATKIIIADADLSTMGVNWLVDLMNEQGDKKITASDWFIIENTYKENPYKYHLLNSPNDFMVKLMRRISEKTQNKISLPIFVCTSTQQITSKNSSTKLTRMAIKISEKILKTFGNQIKVFRIDSETRTIEDSLINALGDNWIDKINDYDMIIVSPSMATGVSIPEHIKFDSVWGYFAGNLTAQSVRQMLKRVRDNCDRFIYIHHTRMNNKRLGTTPEEINNSHLIKAGVDRSLLKNAFGITIPEKEEDDVVLCGHYKRFTNHFLYNQYLRFQARDNLSDFNYKECVLYLLNEAGNTLVSSKKEDNLKVSKEEKKEINYVKEIEKVVEDEGVVEQVVAIATAEDMSELEIARLENKRKINGALSKSEINSQQKFLLKKWYGENNVTEDLIKKHITKRDLKDKIKLGFHVRGLGNGSQTESGHFTCITSDRITMHRSETKYERDAAMVSRKCELMWIIGVFNLIRVETKLTKNDVVLSEIMDKWAEHKKEIKQLFNVNLPKNAKENPIQPLKRLLENIGYEINQVKKTDECRYYLLENFFGNELMLKVDEHLWHDYLPNPEAEVSKEKHKFNKEAVMNKTGVA